MTPLKWITEMLQENDLPFESTHHSADMSMMEVARLEAIPAGRVAKVVPVMADESPVLLVLPSNREIELERAKEILHAESIRLVSRHEISDLFPGCEFGTIPPLRHWRHIGVLMDRTMRVSDDILFPAGSHEHSVRICFDHWFRLVRPCVDSFSHPKDRAYIPDQPIRLVYPLGRP